MNSLFPEDDSASSLEGTAAHWVGWEMLAERTPKEGASAPNGSIVTGEMLDGAEMLNDTIAQQMDGLDLHIEEQVSIPFIDQNCFGTPDVWGAFPGNFEIRIIDYKFGHRFVDEFFNEQGLLYLLGILNKLKIGWATEIPIDVSFTIVQPRCYYRGAPVRTHSYKLSDARPLMRELQLAAIAATGPVPRANTNDGCNDCPGRHSCSALQEAAYSDAEFASDRLPLELTPGAAALELRMLTRALSRLTARVDGLRELTLANLKAGKRIPYFRAEAGSGRRQWNVPTEQVIQLGSVLGKDLSKPGVITPLQAKKVGIDESVISAYSFIPATSIKLVEENPADARRVFGKEN